MPKTLKLYVQDNSWYGCIVVVAKDEESARKLMEKEVNYNSDESVIEHEIKEGVTISNYGDM